MTRGYGSKYDDNLTKSPTPYLINELRDSDEASEMNFHITVPEKVIGYVERNYSMYLKDMYVNSGRASHSDLDEVPIGIARGIVMSVYRRYINERRNSYGKSEKLDLENDRR